MPAVFYYQIYLFMTAVQLPILPDEFWQFVETNRQVNPSTLRLKYHKDGRDWINAAITQIECMNKCKGKFGEFQPELMVSTVSLEQATSANVARLHGELAKSLLGYSANPQMLDMTCGMGIDLKAIVMANPSVTVIGAEYIPELASVTAYNFADFPNVEIINVNSVNWLNENNCDGLFDLIFVDPARRDDNGGKVFNIHHCQPDVVELMPMLQTRCRNLMIKLSPMLDVTQTLRDLPQTTDLYVVDDNGECREILVVISCVGEKSSLSPKIHVWSNGLQFCFTAEEERGCELEFAHPTAGQWLYEPSPAMMKAAPFAIICTRYGLKKLHANTNLFVGDAPKFDLPGRWHEIEHVLDYSSSVLKNLRKTIAQADVAVRNFPIKAEMLQTRLKIKSGGNHRIMGVTTCKGSDSKQQKLLILRKE